MAIFNVWTGLQVLPLDRYGLRWYQGNAANLTVKKFPSAMWDLPWSCINANDFCQCWPLPQAWLGG